MTAANPLVAPRRDTTGPWAGVWIAEDVDTLIAGFQSGSWIDVTIGGFGTTMDTLGLIVDPLGTVAQWGVAWLIEHVKPLSDALDWLAGDPDQISAHAQTWRNVAAACRDAATTLADAVRTGVAEWTGPAADAYRRRAQQQDAALDALSRAADGLALITEGAGLLVALVRGMVRDLIAGFVSTLAVRLPEWSAEEGLSLGIATPLVVEQVSTLVADWAARIARLLRALIASLRRLVPTVRRLTELIDELRKLLRRLARHESVGTGGRDVPLPRQPWATGRTHPSTEPNLEAKPRGEPTVAEPGKAGRGHRRENETAQVLAQHGYDVEQNPPPKPNGKKPDYKIEGEYFDCYSPTAVDPGRVRDGMSAKVKAGQADRLVLNLDDTPVSLDQVREVLARRPIANLKEVIVIRSGEISPLFPS